MQEGLNPLLFTNSWGCSSPRKRKAEEAESQPFREKELLPRVHEDAGDRKGITPITSASPLSFSGILLLPEEKSMKEFEASHADYLGKDESKKKKGGISPLSEKIQPFSGELRPRERVGLGASKRDLDTARETEKWVKPHHLPSGKIFPWPANVPKTQGTESGCILAVALPCREQGAPSNHTSLARVTRTCDDETLLLLLMDTHLQLHLSSDSTGAQSCLWMLYQPGHHQSTAHKTTAGELACSAGKLSLHCKIKLWIFPWLSSQSDSDLLSVFQSTRIACLWAV